MRAAVPMPAPSSSARSAAMGTTAPFAAAERREGPYAGTTIRRHRKSASTPTRPILPPSIRRRRRDWVRGVSTVTEETVVSANRSGPPGCGNGGWVAGLVAERLDDLTAGEGGGPATHIRLTAPTPLERPLRWEVAGTVGEPEDLAVHLLDGDTLLATATHVPAPDLEVPAPVTPEQAAAAVESFDSSGNPFPTCYGCGHEASDGLHVYAAPVPGREEVNAAPVVL